MDLEVEYGFQMTNQGNVLDAAVVVPGELRIPNVAGAYLVGPGVVAGREAVLSG